MDAASVKIDLSYLYLLSSGNKDFEEKLLHGSVADVDRLMNNLQTAWKTQDAGEVRKSAHSLVSLVAIAGVPFIEDSCRKIDQVFADNIFHPEYEFLVEEIVSIWPVAYGQLKELMITGGENASSPNPHSPAQSN
jgi:HPt (histidine-containing phosphotransfer) domain-containing protein